MVTYETLTIRTEGMPKLKDNINLCHPEPLYGEGSPPLCGGILPGTCARGKCRFAHTVPASLRENDILFLMLGTSQTDVLLTYAEYNYPHECTSPFP